MPPPIQTAEVPDETLTDAEKAKQAKLQEEKDAKEKATISRRAKRKAAREKILKD